MNALLADLLRLLELERIEINLFRGASRDIGSAQVFGGQVLGQALVAASATVDDRDAHSLHAYFLRRGDFNAPIVYEVDRSRDGGSFSSRRVVAIQHGHQIFHMSASFQKPETGLDHQVSAPIVSPPESLPDHMTALRKRLDSLPPERRRVWEGERPWEFRLVEPVPDKRQPADSVRHVWFRVTQRCPDDPILHRCLLAYLSDFQLLETALLPHGVSHFDGRLTIASIDHAMWFHRPVRIDDWLLYVLASPSASGSRGFAIGRIYDRGGALVASVAQEGLMRWRDPSAT
jgi:acyl-CoA thioesterase II